MCHTPNLCFCTYPGNYFTQQLAQLELLCQQLYESSDSQVRAQAEKALVTFAESSDSLPQCQIILERSQVPHYACYCYGDVGVDLQDAIPPEASIIKCYILST